MSRCGVILCECNGALERRISLQELSRYIHDIAPDLDIVIGNNLCKSHELNLLIEKSEVSPSVIGACNEICCHSHFWQDVDTKKLNPFFTKIVDLLSEIQSDLSNAEISDRLKLLLGSQISQSFCSETVTPDNLRTRFSPHKDLITRRNLLSALSPQQEVIPSISVSECAGTTCNLCVNSCPVDAITEINNMLKVDKSACTGCGACATICPRGAISYPGYSITDLEREIEGLLSKRVEPPYRILSIVCQSCSDTYNASLKSISPFLFTVKVPSPAVISPLLMLHAFNLGADGVVFIHNEQHCSSKASIQKLNDTLHFTQELLKRWGIDNSRIDYINSDDKDEAPDRLHRFIDKVTQSGNTPFKALAGSMTFEGMYSLSAIIKEMETKLPLSHNSVLSDEYIPFGIVKIDQPHCTGCSICAQTCPTSAISTRMSDDNSSLDLVFQYEKCIACGICVSSCPEKCVTLRKSLDLAKLRAGNLEETIFEDDYIYCRNCSKPYAPKSMVAILKSKLQNAGVLSSEWTEYCQSCRVIIQQKR